MNCRHLSPRGWRHHLPRQRGHWVCDRGRGVVKPCGPLCNESCDQYQEPGTTGPREDTTMADRIKWDSPAGDTVMGAPADLTLEKWAKLQYELGTLTQADLAADIGCSKSVLSSHLQIVPSQIGPGAVVRAEPGTTQPEPQPEPDAGDCQHALDCANADTADCGDETPAGPDSSQRGGFKLEAPADALLAFIQRAGMEREAAMYCAGWADRGREAARSPE